MRKLGASLLACLLSGLAGGLLAQQLAVRSGAGEEFILVFLAVGAVVSVAAICFFVAQFFGTRAIDGTGMALTVLALGALAALWYFVPDERATPQAAAEDTTLLAAMAVGVLATIATHWLTIKLMLRRR